MNESELARLVVDATYRVHTTLGPGSLESRDSPGPHRSFGVSPERLAIRPSMRGPISS